MSGNVEKERYWESIEYARSFCSEEMLRYLDVNLSTDYGETFYDGYIVGVDFSRSNRDMRVNEINGSLELRILTQMYDRGVVLEFPNIRNVTYGGISILLTPFISWIEFMPSDNARLCKIHFLGSSHSINIEFHEIIFRDFKFDSIVMGGDFIGRLK